MEEIKKEPTANEKMSYEELEEVANQLSQQVQRLHIQCQQMNVSNTLARLELLFKVVNTPNVFSEQFIEYCAKEIESLIVLKEKEEEVNTQQ